MFGYPKKTELEYDKDEDIIYYTIDDGERKILKDSELGNLPVKIYNGAFDYISHAVDITGIVKEHINSELSYSVADLEYKLIIEWDTIYQNLDDFNYDSHEPITFRDNNYSFVNWGEDDYISLIRRINERIYIACNVIYGKDSHDITVENSYDSFYRTYYNAQARLNASGILRELSKHLTITQF